MDRTMFGYSPASGTSVLMRHADWLFLDTVLASKPEWVNIVETGTFYGLTTLYLGVIAKVRGGQVHTFDNVDQRKREIVMAWPDCVHFDCESVLDDARREVVRWVSKPHTFAFFDDGNKMAEAYTYGKRLEIGSGFVVHDCGLEWQEGDMDYLIEAYSLVPHLRDEAIELGTSCRCYIRTA